jgi:hypothetical protein
MAPPDERENPILRWLFVGGWVIGLVIASSALLWMGRPIREPTSGSLIDVPTCDADTSSPVEGLPIVQTNVLSFAGNGKLARNLQKVDCSCFIGEFVVGDGLGYNLRLVLGPNRQFNCTWTGCLGVYGTASGKWTVNEVGLQLFAKKSEPMLKSWLPSLLHIVAIENQYLLVPDKDRQSFETSGPSHFYCLHKKESAELLTEAKKQFWASTGDKEPGK